MTLAEFVTRLAKLPAGAGPFASVYLNTHWTDEQQRERTGAFLRSELRHRRAEHPPLAKDLGWIETEAEAVISQARRGAAPGLALFACPSLGLREIVQVRMPFENAVVVGDRPYLRPLAGALGAAPPSLVVFVDAESARLIPILDTGPGEEVRLDSEILGHHRRGGWAQLAASRYQRHIEEERGHHLKAVAEALIELADQQDLGRVVLAGSLESARALREILPATMAGRVAGLVPGGRHEAAADLAARAEEVLAQAAELDVQAAVDHVLTDAAKGGPAQASLEGVLEALQRGAVDRLYLLHSFRLPGRACPDCAALQPGDTEPCRQCRRATSAVELGEAMVTRTIATGGTVTMPDAHPALSAVGGVAARLRFVP